MLVLQWESTKPHSETNNAVPESFASKPAITTSDPRMITSAQVNSPTGNCRRVLLLAHFTLRAAGCGSSYRRWPWWRWASCNLNLRTRYVLDYTTSQPCTTWIKSWGWVLAHISANPFPAHHSCADVANARLTVVRPSNVWSVQVQRATRRVPEIATECTSNCCLLLAASFRLFPTV